MNSRQRILKLIQILRKYSDGEHYLSIDELCTLLQEDKYRKTLNADLKAIEALDNYELTYIHKHGYAFNQAPFTLSEIKILIDALDSLKTLDENFANKLSQKLLSFISIYQRQTITSLRKKGEHEKNYFLYHFEILLNAYSKAKTVYLRRKNKDDIEEIIPLFFDRENDRYYLLYAYPGKKKIYRLRFENIIEVKENKHYTEASFSNDKILKYIKEATNAYHGDESISVTIKLKRNNLNNYLRDDFPIISFFQDNIAVIDTALNARFFAKIFAYQDNIEIIAPKEVREKYSEVMQNILKQY